MAAGDAGSSKSDKPLPPSARRKAKSGGGSALRSGGSAPRKTVSTGTAASGRYTAPVPVKSKGPSPRWVPVLMFGLWVLGLALILLNYMGLLPGSSDGGNGFYLVGGLALILGGIVTATQYR